MYNTFRAEHSTSHVQWEPSCPHTHTTFHVRLKQCSRPFSQPPMVQYRWYDGATPRHQYHQQNCVAIFRACAVAQLGVDHCIPLVVVVCGSVASGLAININQPAISILDNMFGFCGVLPPIVFQQHQFQPWFSLTTIIKHQNRCQQGTSRNR